ncbi:MAG TPA: MBL fold metallo-hydrolase [Actinotalea sp.]|nr:MBL fold metallo-hydrolase [Actinotalea sp.]
MILRTLVAPVLGATCSVLADDAGRCVVVDPGGGVAAKVLALVAAEGWIPVAVLATHGHVDHTWAAAELCAAYDVPLHLHADDAYRLDDPFGTLGALGPQLAAMAGLAAPPRPSRVQTFTAQPDGTVRLHLGTPSTGHLDLAGLHVPGHTEGSTVYLADAPGRTALTGDVLFAGTIGRTDLPGGDPRAMTLSLARLARLAADTVVVPGHGPTSTIAAELASNPYLRAAR